MQDLIASYLFQNKACPLPGLGSLAVTTTVAKSDFIHKTIDAPAPSIQLVHNEISAEPLIGYIAAKTNVNITEASAALLHFCENLKATITNNTPAKLNGIGVLYIDNNGNKLFQQEELPKSFLQPVSTEPLPISGTPSQLYQQPVIEEPVVEQHEYYYEEEAAVAKNRWWIWAILLIAAGVAAAYYYFNVNHNGQWGNMKSILP